MRQVNGNLSRQEAVDTLLYLSEVLTQATEVGRDETDYANRIIIRVAKGLMKDKYKMKVGEKVHDKRSWVKNANALEGRTRIRSSNRTLEAERSNGG